MSEIVLDGVTKVFDDGYEAVKDMNLDIADGEFMILGRALGLRQVDGAADDRRARGHLQRRVEDRRRSRQRSLAEGSRHRDGLPELRALPAHDRAREHGLRALPRRVDKAEIDQQGRGGGGETRPGQTPRPQAGQPLRRPAPAGGDGPGDRPRPESVPDGRAALQPRREAAGADADRGRAPAVGPGNDDGLRHPRPDRGDDPRRPGRGDARRRPPAGRLAGGALRTAEEPLRRRLHRLRPR